MASLHEERDTLSSSRSERGGGDADKPLRAEQAEALLELGGKGYGRNRIALHQRRKVRDHRRYRLQCRGRVAENITAAGDPFLGSEVEKDERRGHDAAARSPHRPLQGRVDGADPERAE